MNVYQFLKTFGSVSSIVTLFTLIFVEQSFAKSEHLTKADVAQLAKESCASELPNLDEQYKTASRKKVNWDSKKIEIVSGYKFSLEKGVLALKPGGSLLSGNTPVNSVQSVLYLMFHFPSLRGSTDSSFISDTREFFKLHPLDHSRAYEIPESLIIVSVNQILDWKRLPITHEIQFWKENYKPNLSAEQIARAKRGHEIYFSGKHQDDFSLENKYVENHEQYGLEEIVSTRMGMFYYEPKNNNNPSPYRIPRFNCDAIGRLGGADCVGHFNMDDEYIVTYQLPYRLMQCWQKVEEGVRRVVRLNTQTTK